MAWNKSDYLAAGIIIFIAAMAILLAAYMTGAWSPTNNTMFPFK